MDPVKLDVKENVAWIEFCDERGLNPMGSSFFEALESIIKKIKKNSEIRCAVFFSSGKNFSVGLDLKEYGGADSEVVYKAASNATKIFESISSIEVPTLALLNGYSIGGAIEMTAHCDFRFASTDTQISLPGPKIGIFNPARVIYRLVELVGKANATELMLTSRMIDATEAFSIGLVSKVCEQEELKAEADAWINFLSEEDTDALRFTKKLLNSTGKSYKKYSKIEDKLLRKCFKSDTPSKMIQAFLGKSN